jgi:dipeptidase D
MILRRGFVAGCGAALVAGASACAKAPATVPSPLTTTLDAELDAHLVPFLRALVAFPTVAGQKGAHEAQKAWLLRAAEASGLVGRDADTFVEIDLPGPPGAPVMGLVVHGDVVPVVAAAWAFPPFELTEQGDFLQGRGVADDKGPLAVALLVLRTLANAHTPRTHTVRLLVGSTEESSAEDLKRYLATHEPPAFSLVLDSDFPVVVGEKAWNALEVTSAAPEQTAQGLRVVGLTAGTATSIVPDEARLTIEGEGAERWITALAQQPLDAGTRAEIVKEAVHDRFTLVVRGKAAHAGVNLAGGRNALVALARLVSGKLPRGAAADVLAFAEVAGEDVFGTGLGLTEDDPLWGRYAVNVATIGLPKDGRAGLVLTTNLRRVPPRSGAELRAHLERRVQAFAEARGTQLGFGGYFESKLWAVDPEAPLVRRLRAVHARVTGQRLPPVVSAGGTYAKRLPNSVPFGLWPGEKTVPYAGHDVDERMAKSELRRGAHVVLAAVLDLACGAPLVDPLGKPVVLP